MINISKELLSNIGSFFNQNEIDFINKIVNLTKENKIEFGKWNCFDENDNLKIIALNRSNANDDVKEYHRKYIDFHLTISGLDTIYIGEKDFVEIENNVKEQDFCLVRSNTVQKFELNSNEFLILNQGVFHCNVLDKDSIKLVIKKK